MDRESLSSSSTFSVQGFSPNRLRCDEMPPCFPVRHRPRDGDRHRRQVQHQTSFQVHHEQARERRQGLSRARADRREGLRRLSRGRRRLAGTPGRAGVDIGKYKVLKAAVPIRGRAVPILFAAYPKWKLKRSQNQFEEAFFDLLSKLLPPKTWTVIVADRLSVDRQAASRGPSSRASCANSR